MVITEADTEVGVSFLFKLTFSCVGGDHPIGSRFHDWPKATKSAPVNGGVTVQNAPETLLPKIHRRTGWLDDTTNQWVNGRG